ncbi:MAG: di-trans,poly-cis-decaprenylcistransferase [Streptomyces sp.]|jgi:undecaprenyl diphosphate synthase|nr:di-trans,poly-cis-decaprenylcistransferase [Streptomyces sp.]
MDMPRIGKQLRRSRPGPAPEGQATGDDTLRSAYRLCRDVTRRQDPEAYVLLRMLPAVLQPACWAVWAALSVVDDLIDSRDVPPAERVARAERWIAALEADSLSGASADPVRHALIDSAAQWHLDLSDLRDGMRVSLDDVHHGHFDDWAQWRAWSRGHVVPTFDLLRKLLGRAGVPVVLRLDQQAGYEQVLDGSRLVDTLTDLATDLRGDGLLLPLEVLEQFPGAESDLRDGRWTAAAAALIAELTGIARRWVGQPGLTHSMHPGPAVVVDAMTAIMLAQLDAVEAAGPDLLRSAPRPAPMTRVRILAPARIRSALAWRLTPMAVPSARRPSTATLPRPVARPVGPAVFKPPPRHATDCRPPRIQHEAMPAHVAIVMDGNGRWAEHRGLPRSDGHRAGLAAVHEIVYGALEIGLPHLTVYGFSTENWRRDTEEVAGLMDMLRTALDGDTFRDLDVRMRWSGQPEKLPVDLVESLRHMEFNTRARTGLTFTLCFNYGGRDEITRAAAALARAARAGQVEPDLISEDDITRHLPISDMPSVDLLWRTGGEQRTSNFLPWQSTYAELYFTDDSWPDVDRRDLWQAIIEYGNRRRRYGTAGPTSASAAGLTVGGPPSQEPSCPSPDRTARRGQILPDVSPPRR